MNNPRDGLFCSSPLVIPRIKSDTYISHIPELILIRVRFRGNLENFPTAFKQATDPFSSII